MHEPLIVLSTSVAGERVDSFSTYKGAPHTEQQILAWSALVDQAVTKALVRCPNCRALCSKVRSRRHARPSRLRVTAISSRTTNAPT